MKVLIVSSANSGKISPFILEQVESITKLGVEFEYFKIYGRGISGYLKNVRHLKNKINSFKPDILHAHYGLSGLLSVISRGRVPLIVTFHGNDINPINPGKKLVPNWNRNIAQFVHIFNNSSIFVTDDIASQINSNPAKSDIIPCHVNLDTFCPMDKNEARKQLGLLNSKKFVLFSSSFKTTIKNYPLAREACLHFDNLELVELKGLTRNEVSLYLNACDMALITSYNEGSCQFLKEAMACNRPIVSTKVGDSEWIFGDTEGCFSSSFEPLDVIRNIEKALDFSSHNGHTYGRNRIMELGLDSETISRKVLDVYRKVIKQNG